MGKFLTDAQDFLPILIQGGITTIAIAISSLIIATVFGLILALMRYSAIPILSRISQTIVNVVRGIPILVQLFYIYFVLPDLGVNLSAFQAGSLGLGLAYSAYMAENFRAGLEAVDNGQIEAAQTIGMTWPLMMRRIILPQAIRTVLPPYGNTMIMLLKDTSQASVITVAEMSFQAKMLAASTFENITVYSLVAALYLLFSIPLIILATYLERRFSGK